jgi:hypothetical protein
MLMPAALFNQHDHYLEQHEAGQRNNAPPLKNKISEVLGQHKDGTLIPMRLALSQAEAGSAHVCRPSDRSLGPQANRAATA